MIRFYYVIITKIFSIFYHIKKMKKWAKDSTKKDEDICEYTHYLIDLIKKRGRITIKSQGQDKLPKEGGYILYSNHQGKFDGQCVLDAFPYKAAYLASKKLDGKLLVTQFTAMTGGKYIDLNNPRSQVGVLNEITEEVRDGKRFIIFPEGGYNDNRNNLIEFKSGCFTPAIRTGCPIVPVCLYDAYKIFNVNSLKKVTAYVFILDPIYYDEYKGLRKKEIAELVKRRINAKLDELKQKEAQGEDLID